MIDPIYIQIDPNPNCETMDGLVFQPRSEPRAVTQVRIQRDGQERWCEVTGLNEGSQPCPAIASVIDDSGDGACYLVTGGEWGLRLQNGPDRWGEPYLMLPGDGADLRFA